MPEENQSPPNSAINTKELSPELANNNNSMQNQPDKTNDSSSSHPESVPNKLFDNVNSQSENQFANNTDSSFDKSIKSSLSSTPKITFSRVWLIIALVATAIILILGGIWWWQNRSLNTVNLVNTREGQLEFVSENLTWMASSLDDRGLYTDVNVCNYESGSDLWTCTAGAQSNRAFLPVIWAEYQYYLATGNENVLAQLKKDIAATSNILVSSDIYVIQNNYYNCLLMSDILTDEKVVFSEEEKNALQMVCLQSINEIFDQANFLATISNPSLDEEVIRGDITSLTSSINKKVALINAGQIADYQIANDSFFADRSPENWASLAVPQYYYFAQDDLARYRLSGQNTDLAKALTMIDDVLSLYIAQEQGIIGEKYEMSDCLLDAIYKEIEYYGGLGLTPLQLNFAFKADQSYSAACYLAQLHRANNDDPELAAAKNSILKNANYSTDIAKGGPTFFTSLPVNSSSVQAIGDLIENSSLIGVLSR